MSRRIAYVRWIDSTSHGAVHKDSPKPEIGYIESSGLIVFEDDDIIQLALHFNWKQDHYTEDITIPKVAIKKIRRFKIS